MTLVDYEGNDIETDLLPQFCSHKKTILMSSDWANVIRHEGQRFDGRVVEFRKVLRRYLIEVGFEFAYVKNEVQG